LAISRRAGLFVETRRVPTSGILDTFCSHNGNSDANVTVR